MSLEVSLEDLGLLYSELEDGKDSQETTSKENILIFRRELIAG